MDPPNGAFEDGLSEELCSKLEQSHSVLKQALETYSSKQIFLSFNGGKDCTVILHLLSQNLKNSISNFKVIYLRSSDPFDEIEEFVKSCETYYKIKIIGMQLESSMKELLTNICMADKDIAAVFMGSRRSDPYCQSLNTFQSTDRGWPELMRINPILDWTCENVWEYLLKKNVPYCTLYNLGFTSIGNKQNTRPNPHLEVQPGSFLPAYKLLNDSLERAGRT